MSQRRYPCSKRLAKVRPWGGSKVTVVAKDKQKSMVKHTYTRDMIQQNGRDELHRDAFKRENDTHWYMSYHIQVVSCLKYMDATNNRYIVLQQGFFHESIQK
jgi:hypothetical protein